MALIRTAILLALLFGAHAEAVAPVVVIYDVECDGAQLTALIVQVNPVKTTKIVRFVISKTVCGTPS